MGLINWFKENTVHRKMRVNDVQTFDTLVVERRELGWLVAVVLTALLFSFLVGYFVGQRRSARLFVHQAQVDALADQQILYASQEELVPSLDTNNPDSAGAITGNHHTQVKYQARIATTCSLTSATSLVKQAMRLGVGLHAHKIVKRGRECYRISTFLYDTRADLEIDLVKLAKAYKVPNTAISIISVNKKEAQNDLGVSPNA